MRNGLIALVSLLALASTAACSSSNDTGGTGGTASTMGGQSSSGGKSSSGGQQSTGGTMTGGYAPTGGGSNSEVTTLSGTKALNTLTADEFTQLCNETYAYFGNAISRATICKWKGVYFATQSSAPTEEKLRQNCTSKEQPCLGETASPWTTFNCSEIPSDCTKTVTDYSACIRDYAAWWIQKVSEVPDCDAFTSAYWTPVWDILGADQPASCFFCTGYYAPNPREF